ncbi:MAG: hypothetical protein KDC95_01045 [Planctomycetes bacterium]|nr:hypothetical protein [Planctomycetota bacterium]
MRLLVTILLLECISTALHAQGQWVSHSPAPTPPHRILAGMAYDTRRDVAVMFGGLGFNTRLNDTWEWNGSTWSQRSPASSPIARQSFSMAYDAARGVTLLFGGVGLGDTWQYDGTSWTQRNPASSPSARWFAHMAFDSRRGRMVLFGGYVQGSGMVGDTWEWDGTTWSQVQVSNGPSARCCGSMIYDPARGVCVLFGGALTTQAWDSDETWEYDGVTWTLRPTSVQPSARRGGHLVYDHARERVVLFGGGFGEKSVPVSDDTWEWDGEYWVERNPSARPSKRSLHAMAFMRKRNEAVMFGGYDSSSAARPSETWTYTALHTAQIQNYGVGCRGTVGTPRLDRAVSGPWMGWPFVMRASSLPQSGASVLFVGSSSKTWGVVPLPLKLDSIGMAGCELLASPDVLIPAPIANGSAAWSLMIPSISLTGVQFFTQAIVVDGGANAFGATLTNGLEATIGDL